MVPKKKLKPEVVRFELSGLTGAVPSDIVPRLDISTCDLCDQSPEISNIY